MDALTGTRVAKFGWLELLGKGVGFLAGAAVLTCGFAWVEVCLILRHGFNVATGAIALGLLVPGTFCTIKFFPRLRMWYSAAGFVIVLLISFEILRVVPMVANRISAYRPNVKAILIPADKG